MLNIADLNVKIFADGAELNGIQEMVMKPYIKGFTTNPSLLRKAGVTDYKAFALQILDMVRDKPVSFEVFSDDFDEMLQQALEIASWGSNVYVKIPVTNTRGKSAAQLIHNLATAGVKQNVTALLTMDQVESTVAALADGPSAFISIFAGRIADTGIDPLPLMQAAVKFLSPFPQLELIWASPRELLNLFQAHDIGCQIITVTHDILKKIPLVGKDLTAYSLETVKMFFDDAHASGLRLSTRASPVVEV
jgi:transaldolase